MWAKSFKPVTDGLIVSFIATVIIGLTFVLGRGVERLDERNACVDVIVNVEPEQHDVATCPPHTSLHIIDNNVVCKCAPYAAPTATTITPPAPTATAPDQRDIAL